MLRPNPPRLITVVIAVALILVGLSATVFPIDIVNQALDLVQSTIGTNVEVTTEVAWLFLFAGDALLVAGSLFVRTVILVGPRIDIEFATADGNKLAVAQAHFLDGGPLWTVSLYYDKGSVPKYSYMFLAGSIILFGIHLPLLDIAERKRKDFLTGGAAPPWYGPA